MMTMKNTKLKFKKTPMCELLHDKPATFFLYRGGYTPAYASKEDGLPEDVPLFMSPSEIKSIQPKPVGNWMFVSLEAPEKPTDYHFEIKDFFKSPASTIDWLAHLNEKAWFDANDFCDMMHRFREATDSYGAL
jgi:hypothetical protein